MLLKTILVSTASVGGGAVAVLGGLLVLGTHKPPPPMPAVDGVAVAAARSQPMADLQRFSARDGVALAYRRYQPVGVASPPKTVAILIHGSGGSSANMNILGRSLAARGTPAYAPDSRGHGDSGPRGDIDHVGQLEEDVADLVGLVRRTYPNTKLVLVGHSSGGGFTLRVAGGPVGPLFDRFVLLAPFLGSAAPTSRPASGGWVEPYLGRIVGLKILNRLGIHGFDGLPVLAFATEPGATPRTWSYRLTQNFGPSNAMSIKDNQSYRTDARKAAGRVQVFAGALDESMFADKYAEAFAGLPVPVPLEIFPKVHHMDLISDPTAVSRVVEAINLPLPPPAIFTPS